MPLALQLHLWHCIFGVSVCVPEKRIAQQGWGDVLYWFHSRPRLCERTQWRRSVLRRPVICYVVDPSAEATRELSNCHRWLVLRYGTGTHCFLAGYTCQDPAPSPARVRQWWCAWRFYLTVVDMQCIRTTPTCDYVCRPVDMGLRWYLCCDCRACYASACIVDAKKCTSRRHPMAQVNCTRRTRTRHTEGHCAPVGGRGTPGHCNGTRN